MKYILLLIPFILACGVAAPVVTPTPEAVITPTLTNTPERIYTPMETLTRVMVVCNGDHVNARYKAADNTMAVGEVLERGTELTIWGEFTQHGEIWTITDAGYVDPKFLGEIK
jgi:hypothetical protein